MKKILVLTVLLLFSLPVAAEDYYENINMTPLKTFSGFSNKNIRTTYPQLNTPHQLTPMNEQRRELMKAKSVTEMGNSAPRNDGVSPMTYSQFPQKMDSSNMMHIQSIQNGIQNMYMGF